MSETLYHVSANPHVRDNGSTQKLSLIHISEPTRPY